MQELEVPEEASIHGDSKGRTRDPVQCIRDSLAVFLAPSYVGWAPSSRTVAKETMGRQRVSLRDSVGA